MIAWLGETTRSDGFTVLMFTVNSSSFSGKMSPRIVMKKLVITDPAVIVSGALDTLTKSESSIIKTFIL